MSTTLVSPAGPDDRHAGRRHALHPLAPTTAPPGAGAAGVARRPGRPGRPASARPPRCPCGSHRHSTRRRRRPAA